MRDRNITLKQFSSINDLPTKIKREPRVDFHALIRVSLYNKFAEASEKTGYERNEILDMALESFLNNKKP